MITTNFENKITSPEIFFRKTSLYNEDGIFSEKIFGPIKNYRCRCGKLNSELLDSGKRCDKCEVLCDSNELRFETFGVIDLPFYCIKPNKFEKEIASVITNINQYKKTLFEPLRSKYNITKSKYLGINKKTCEIKIFENRTDKNSIYIPLRITGIYSFILCLRYICEKFTGFLNVKELFEKQYIMSYLKVIPPGLRPIVFIKPKKTQTTEINKHYISILKIIKTDSVFQDNIKIDEQDWFDRIDLYFSDDNFEDSDEEIVEHAIIEYDLMTSRYQFYINQIYQNIQSTISGKEGFIRHNTLGKTIEFSARSVVVADPSLKPYQIGVSREILFKLWAPYFLHWLIKVRKENPSTCYKKYIKDDDYQTHKKVFNEFLEWMTH